MATRHTFDEGNVASTHGTRRCAAVGRAGDIAHAVSEAAQVEREHPAEQLRRSTRLQQPHHTQRAREELCSFGARILRERSIAKLHALEERRVHEARSSTFLGLGLGLEQLGDLDRLVHSHGGTTPSTMNVSSISAEGCTPVRSTSRSSEAKAASPRSRR